MNPELLLLSSRIAALVLLASLLAFGIAWKWQSLRSRKAGQTLAEEGARHAQAELRAAELQEALTTTEQQCLAAMEQRDEAEREAVARRNEATRLADQITTLHATLAPREEIDRLKQLLAERDSDLWQARPALPDAAHPLQSELETLRAEQAGLTQKLSEAEAEAMRLRSEKKAAEAATQRQQVDKEVLARLREEAESLRKDREDLNQKLAGMSADLDRMAAEKRDGEAALQARIEELLKAPAPVAGPIRSFTLTSPRLTAQPFLPSATQTDDAASGPSEPMEFPPAPARADVRDGLFRDADISSLPPDQPSLEDVLDVVNRMALELDEKEQVLEAVSQELRQREQSLADLRTLEPGAEDKLKAAEKRAAEARKRADEAVVDCARARRHLRAVRRSIEVLESHPMKADNLTLIKGVKNVINSQLHAYGIFTYRQIVQWDEEDLQAFSELLSFKQRIWRDKWQEQARQLHESRYGERLAA